MSNIQSEKSNKEFVIDFNRKYIQLLIEKKQIINYNWLGVSRLYNYINDDPLLDWLNMYGQSKCFKTDEELDYDEYVKNNSNKLNFDEFKKLNCKFSFTKYILEQGIKYEKHIYMLLKEKFGEKIIDVGNFPFEKFEYDKKLEKTKELISNCIPIIYQGLVCDPDTKTFGYPDLIVREDYICHFINNGYDCKTNIYENNYNYYIIDIKYHTLQLKKNSNDIIPDPSQKQYISQMYLYTKGLRHLINPSVIKCDLLEHKSYIIGRSWNFDNKLTGSICFKDYSRILEKVKNGLDWLKKLKHEGKYWDPTNPHIYELYPNMKNEKDNNWKKTKQLLSEKIGEFTMIWNCSNSVKYNSHLNNIYSWKDPRFNIFDYMNKNEISTIIDNIIKINNQSVKLYDYNKNVKIKNWKSIDILSFSNKNKIIMEGFIDIENTIDIRTIDKPKEDGIVYMLGLYYNNNIFTSRTKKYKKDMFHKTFCVKQLNKKQEEELIKDFILFLKSFNCEKHITWRLYHFSGTEKYTLNKLMNNYNISPEEYGITIEWIDLYDILIKYMFVFKNCFDYSIKSINKVLYDLGNVSRNYTYENLSIKNGLDTIIAVFECDENSKNITFNKSKLMDSVIYYNSVDCISLFYIRNFLESVIEN